MAIATEQVAARTPLTKEERLVIVASSVGTVFEWYDFYLYATLAPFFATLFFPKGNDTAALLSAFAAYAAGFLVRPFGALVFGRIGDLVGRKYTFLVTIVVMGLSTFAVGLLPTYASIGWWAPILLVTLRLLPGPGAGRRIRRCRHLRRRALRRMTVAATPPAGSRPRRRWASSSSPRRSSGLPPRHDRQGVRRLGLAHSVPGVGHPAGVLGLHPAEAATSRRSSRR